MAIPLLVSENFCSADDGESGLDIPLQELQLIHYKEVNS